MLFNSLPFLIFLPTVFALYWFVFKKYLRVQNGFVIVASYVFYGWWDYRFLGLIIVSTLIDFCVGFELGRQKHEVKRRVLLLVSLVCNLGLLGFFKYYNFFVDTWVDAWHSLGVVMHPATLQIILPVGISFYTFQTLSYTIDIYRKELKPTKDLVAFAAYVSFFPQLVAGPIERARHLLPQFTEGRHFVFDFAKSGLHLILWGLFKKVVVADNCAFFVSLIFENPSGFSTLELLLGAVLFGFQIYGDFSGYSDMAIGMGRLFGFHLRTNFRFPYFSRNIAEFWRRWHVSLSTWFRDYVYIPLGGSRVSLYKQVRNVCIVFLVSGFWHGANWTFIVWGGIHALLFVPLLLFRNTKKYQESGFALRQLLPMIGTFLLVTLAWVFFRSNSIEAALIYLKTLFLFKAFDLDVFYNTPKYLLFSLISGFSILIMLCMEFRAFKRQRDALEFSFLGGLIIALLIMFLGVFKNPSDFIYFQF
ncbi:MBOAT family O-acyltransferase [Snuella lapsa]|uniref:MBOAT family protein n=1 Tax=Snuella lapsa TaxID=870481 RepID=A0ABP6XSQ2_9FLAO